MTPNTILEMVGYHIEVKGCSEREMHLSLVQFLHRDAEVELPFRVNIKVYARNPWFSQRTVVFVESTQSGATSSIVCLPQILLEVILELD